MRVYLFVLASFYFILAIGIVVAISAGILVNVPGIGRFPTKDLVSVFGPPVQSSQDMTPNAYLCLEAPSDACPQKGDTANRCPPGCHADGTMALVCKYNMSFRR